jgi:hypothetical protein
MTGAGGRRRASPEQLGALPVGKAEIETHDRTPCDCQGGFRVAGAPDPVHRVPDSPQAAGDSIAKVRLVFDQEEPHSNRSRTAAPNAPQPVFATPLMPAICYLARFGAYPYLVLSGAV